MTICMYVSMRVVVRGTSGTPCQLVSTAHLTLHGTRVGCSILCTYTALHILHLFAVGGIGVVRRASSSILARDTMQSTSFPRLLPREGHFPFLFVPIHSRSIKITHTHTHTHTRSHTQTHKK